MIHQASIVILGTMNPSRLGFPAPNRPETLVAVAEYLDVRLGGSGGTNPARRFWTRLPVALRRRSNFQRDSFAVYLTGEPSAQNPGSISISPIESRWSPKPKQAGPWLSKWNSCSGGAGELVSAIRLEREDVWS